MDQTTLLLGESESGAQKGFHYWDGNELQAIRQGPWKLRLPGLKKLRKWPELDRGTQDVELYHLKRDLSESGNVADEYPEIVERLKAIAEKAKKSSVFQERKS